MLLRLFFNCCFGPPLTSLFRPWEFNCLSLFGFLVISSLQLLLCKKYHHEEFDRLGIAAGDGLWPGVSNPH